MICKSMIVLVKYFEVYEEVLFYSQCIVRFLGVN